LEQAVRADTLSAMATALLGVAYIKVNRHDDARKVLVRSIALDSTSALAHGLLASTLHEHSYEHEAAYGHARRALQLDPTDLSWRTNYVEACFATKRFDEARDSALSVAGDTGTKAGEYRPLMYFFATASRLLQNRRADARLELQRFVDAYGATPIGFWKEWEFKGTKHFVMEVAGASEENKIAILSMIRVLEQPKTASSIDDFFKSLPADLVTGVRRPPR